MKYKFQHMHSWRSVAQRDEHWQTMPEVPGSNPARSPQWIICSGGAGPDQRDDGGDDQTREMTEERTRPRVEQTREMTEEQLTGWRSMWLETGTADQMEWQPKQSDNSKEESNDSTQRKKKGGPWPWSPPGLQDNDQQRLWIMFFLKHTKITCLWNKLRQCRSTKQT